MPIRQGAALRMARLKGVDAEATVTAASHGDLSVAADCPINLRVIGAYGHGRLREMTFGTSTRQNPQKMMVPDVMSNWLTRTTAAKIAVARRRDRGVLIVWPQVHF